MYSQRFDLDNLEMAADGYDGVVACARAKRPRSSWPRPGRLASALPVWQLLHAPGGWVGTPGLQAGLPGFWAAWRPLLRSPAHGAGTAVWLAAGGTVDATTNQRARGGFFHDRRPRAEERFLARRASRPGDADALLTWCAGRTGTGTPTPWSRRRDGPAEDRCAGANGSVGCRLVERLAGRGHPVVALARHAMCAPAGPVEAVGDDVGDVDATSAAHCVVWGPLATWSTPWPRARTSPTGTASWPEPLPKPPSGRAPVGPFTSVAWTERGCRPTRPVVRTSGAAGVGDPHGGATGGCLPGGGEHFFEVLRSLTERLPVLRGRAPGNTI
jgi:hypothetical protein